MGVWKNEPFVVQVKAGERKAICNCRHSSTPPFCDGSHKGTEYEPTVVSFDQDQAVYFCGCHQSGNRPFCDGTHEKL